MTEPGSPQVEWRIEATRIPYPDALTAMEARCADIAARTANEIIWLVEHPPVYTAGTSARAPDLLDARFPVYPAGRGGKYTYHGPGQRVVYPLLDLGRRGRDVRAYVCALEGWAIAALGHFGVKAWRAKGRVGIWTDDHGTEAKIGAIGVRLRRWITSHGLAINVDPALEDFTGIVPCGLGAHPVTSLARLGVRASLADLDAALQAERAGFLAAIGQDTKRENMGRAAARPMASCGV